jgi:hypothetical protein
MKRLLSVLSVAFAVTTTALWAQSGTIQLASPNGYNAGGVQVVWNAGQYDVYAPLGGDVIIPLHFYVFGTGLSDWNSFAIDLLYNTSKMDVGVYDQSSNGSTPPVWLSTVQGTFTALQLVASPNAGITGTAAGQVVSPPNSATTNFQVAVSAGGSTRNRFSDNPAWPETPYNVLLTDSDYSGSGNPTPFLLKLKNVQAGDTFSFALGQNGISFISRGTRRTANGVLGTWHIVPEPASMIALGSGLVGLLALRRRRQA